MIIEVEKIKNWAKLRLIGVLRVMTMSKYTRWYDNLMRIFKKKCNFGQRGMEKYEKIREYSKLMIMGYESPFFIFWKLFDGVQTLKNDKKLKIFGQRRKPSLNRHS